MGKNGIDYDHVIMHMVNVPVRHLMSHLSTNTGGYALSTGRQYLLNNMLPALQALGIPFDEPWIKALPRRMSKGGTAYNPGYDIVEDKLFLPTEYEMFGVHTYSNSLAEAAEGQGRWEWYDSNAKRIKKLLGGVYTQWEVSPSSGEPDRYCRVQNDGAPYHCSSGIPEGIVPAICIAAE